MENRQNIIDELMQVAPSLEGLQHQTTFVVPHLYFSSFSETVVRRLQAGEEPLYYFPTSNPYSVPAGYFHNLASDVLHKVRTKEVRDELQAVAPVLNTVSKAPVYEVPETYFHEPLTKTIQRPTAKISSLKSVRRFTRYAVAAVIFFVMAIGMYLLQINRSTVSEKSNLTQQVKSLSEQEIIQYLKNNVPNENISATVAGNGSLETEVSKTIDKMSDKEIQQYLAEMGEKVEI